LLDLGLQLIQSLIGLLKAYPGLLCNDGGGAIAGLRRFLFVARGHLA
jgi:hypothetical protein